MIENCFKRLLFTWVKKILTFIISNFKKYIFHIPSTEVFIRRISPVILWGSQLIYLSTLEANLFVWLATLMNRKFKSFKFVFRIKLVIECVRLDQTSKVPKTIFLFAKYIKITNRKEKKADIVGSSLHLELKPIGNLGIYFNFLKQCPKRWETFYANYPASNPVCVTRESKLHLYKHFPVTVFELKITG